MLFDSHLPFEDIKQHYGGLLSEKMYKFLNCDFDYMNNISEFKNFLKTSPLKKKGKLFIFLFQIIYCELMAFDKKRMLFIDKNIFYNPFFIKKDFFSSNYITLVSFEKNYFILNKKFKPILDKFTFQFYYFFILLIRQFSYITVFDRLNAVKFVKLFSAMVDKFFFNYENLSIFEIVLKLSSF